MAANPEEAGWGWTMTVSRDDQPRICQLLGAVASEWIRAASRHLESDRNHETMVDEKVVM